MSDHRRPRVRTRASAATAAVACLLVSTGGCLVGSAPLPNPNDLNPALPTANAAAREKVIIGQLRNVKNSEDLYYGDKSRYGTVQELIAAEKLNRDITGLGYDITITVTKEGQGYELVARPRVYPANGQRSFFLDETGVLRGANKTGGPASASDPPLQDP
jgi:hypothetical protein